jgi:hypothetical protein
MQKFLKVNLGVPKVETKSVSGQFNSNQGFYFQNVDETFGSAHSLNKQ